MSDFPCQNSLGRIFINIGARHFSFARTIVDKITFIYAQQSTPTDRYWWRIGPAKLDVATTNFEAWFRRPISSSISAPFYQLIHQNVSNDVVYCRANREANMTSASYLILRYNAEVGSCHGWRVVVWVAYFFSHFEFLRGCGTKFHFFSQKEKSTKYTQIELFSLPPLHH